MSTPTPLAPKVGQSFVMVNDLYTFRATSAETNGSYMLIDAVIPPGGGPPPHIHTRETEIFVVIEGQVTCTESNATSTLGPGETITLLPHKPHTFRNNTDKPARMLVICLPRGHREDGSPNAAKPVDASYVVPPARPPTPAEIEQLTASCERAGISFVSLIRSGCFPPRRAGSVPRVPLGLALQAQCVVPHHAENIEATSCHRRKLPIRVSLRSSRRRMDAPLSHLPIATR